MKKVYKSLTFEETFKDSNSGFLTFLKNRHGVVYYWFNSNLTPGKIYDVRNSDYVIEGVNLYSVIDDFGLKCLVPKSHFIELSDSRNQKLKNIIK